MPAYLTPADFAQRSVIPTEYLDAIDRVSPGWLAAQLEQLSGWIDSRLSKRYSAPFVAPYPSVVLLWLTDLATLAAYLRRGVNAQDEQFELIREAAERARIEIKEAADSESGLLDLPLASGASAISKGAPFVYSETSPYVWTDIQRQAALDEDATGRGTGG